MQYVKGDTGLGGRGERQRLQQVQNPRPSPRRHTQGPNGIQVAYAEGDEIDKARVETVVHDSDGKLNNNGNEEQN